MKRLAVLLVLSLAALGLRAGDYPDHFVEYLESTTDKNGGRQYIDLGDVLRSNTVAVIDYMGLNDTKSGYQLFGALNNFLCLSMRPLYVRGKINYGDGPSKDVRYMNRFDVQAQSIAQSTDRGATWSFLNVQNNTSGIEGAGANAYLFWAYGSTKAKANMRVYSCSITNGETLVRDVYPCVKNGTPALYDTANGTYYYDVLQKEPFAVGPKVDVPLSCFDSGYEVVVDPLLFGTPDPACGIADCTHGEYVTFRLTGADQDGRYLSADGKSRARLANATYSVNRGTPETITDVTSFTRAIAGVAKISWNFTDTEYALTINPAAVGTATYTMNGQPVTAGTTIWLADAAVVTVKAVPAYGTRFVKWTDGTKDLGTDPEIRVASAAGGLTLQPVFRTCVCVNKDSSSAVEDGTPENPYKTIQAGIDAVSSDRGEVIVAANAYPAVYSISAELTGNASHPITLTGETGNPRDLVIDANRLGRCLNFSDASFVSGFTFTNGLATTSGGVSLANGSMLSNCVVTCCTASNAVGNASGGGLALGTSCTATHCLIENCECISTAPAENSKSPYVYGGGCDIRAKAALLFSTVRRCRAAVTKGLTYQSAGRAFGGGVYVYTTQSSEANCSRVQDCVVEDCVCTNMNPDVASDSGAYWGGGIYGESQDVGAIQIVRCKIRRNAASSSGGALSLRKATVCDCEIVDNVAKECSAISTPAYGGIFRNCLFARNRGGTCVSGGDDKVGLGFYSCTFADNPCANASGLVWSAGNFEKAQVKNCIFANRGTAAVLPDGLVVDNATNVTYTAAANAPADGTNLQIDDPLFKARGSGDYRIRFASPCKGVGAVESWMDTATDLAGAPRRNPEDTTVDIGAYQHTPFVGFSIQVR